MTHTTAALSCIALFTIACSAAAGEPAARRTTAYQTAATFEALDKNADQQISRTEAGVDRKLSDGFAYADTNADGYLSKDEYTAHTQSPRDPS